MIFLIMNAVLSAILFLVVVLPLLYIYNPDKYPGEPNDPPRAGEVIPDAEVTHAVKQKLYLLFIIPTCAAVNAIFLYFAYYRPIRYIHYRVELSLLTLRLTLDAGRQQLQRNGVCMTASRASSTVANFSLLGNNSMPSRNYTKKPGLSLSFDGNENSRQKLASVNWEWRRHTRPKSVRRDAWVNSAVFAEISALRDEVEQHFLLECSVAEANFTKAVVKIIGAFLPASTPTMLKSQVPLPMSDPPQKDFYNSSQPPLITLGSRAPLPERASTNNPNGSNNVNLRGAQIAQDELLPPRADSVILVPVESGRRRNSVNNNGESRYSSGQSSVPSAALRFFRGGRKGAATGSSTSADRQDQENAVATAAGPLSR